jgi:hypothetical protein
MCCSSLKEMGNYLDDPEGERNTRVYPDSLHRKYGGNSYERCQ